ncbi:aminotransferase-like domain-containing protein [Paraburkholderia xenovorans]|uniref:hypothetical protein n=1 Tax=Paraburkholderia xenovorans TaxID=36873 RepID=UPI0038B7BB3C
MRMLYGERAEALTSAVERHLSGLLALAPIAAGLDAPTFLPQGASDADAARRAAREGIETRPLSLYAIDRPAPPGLVLGFAPIGVEEIESGVIALTRALTRRSR